MNLKLLILIISLTLFTSCTPDNCPDLDYNPEEGITKTNGKLFTGRCIVFHDIPYEDQIYTIRRYRNGKDHGVWKFYHTNGKLETKGRFIDGNRAGKWKYYYDNGNLFQISNYKNGQKSGKWIRFDTNKDTIWVRNFKNDILIN